jgi:phosphohistidine swiveling domain-containing protein
MEVGSVSLPFVLPLSSVDRSMIDTVGGKAANLGALLEASRRSKCFHVPDGFVVTAEAYRIYLNSGLNHSETKGILKALIDQLETLYDDVNLDDVREIGARLRETLYHIPFPDDIALAIKGAWENLENCHKELNQPADETNPLYVAIRSSATSEDSPQASFAGQHETYLNVSNYESVLVHIKSCWISLFTDRAIIYRLKQKMSFLKSYLCVVVHFQVNPTLSGIMFTADPVTGQRNITVIDAGYGLGEALVSGMINPDTYKCNRKTGTVEKTVRDQEIEVVPVFNEFNTSDKAKIGGTKVVNIEETRKGIQKLTDDQIKCLVSIGAAVERVYSDTPQDIEWCIQRGTNKLYLVQTRPITSLFPLPEGAIVEADLKVYFSFGHIQVMMDPVRPCGRSVFKHMMKFVASVVNVVDAGCFMYIDMTRILQILFLRKLYIFILGKTMNSMAMSLAYVMEKDVFRTSRHSMKDFIFIIGYFIFVGPMLSTLLFLIFLKPNLERTAAMQSALMDSYVAKFRGRLNACDNPRQKLNEAIHTIEIFHKTLFPMRPPLTAGFLAMGILRKLVATDVDEEYLDAIERGLSGNVTTEMNLAIGDLADVARKEPRVMNWLKSGQDLTMSGLYNLYSGDTMKFRAAFQDFLDRYGSRANSEIDISRPRWRDDPSPIFQAVRGNLANTEEGHHRKHHEKLIKDGLKAANHIISSVPWYKRILVQRLIQVARSLMAVREHPKFFMIKVLDEVRQVILEISSTLVKRGYLESEVDIWFLTLDEIAESLDWSKEKLQRVVAHQKEMYEVYSRLKPPIVLTSEGECVNISPNSVNIPSGALPGFGVSSGVAEGVAKVVMDPTSVVLHSGEILVAQCTDPGWTPLFLNAAGVVMEVGGYLTHGSVVSREYGLPAVSCVENATSVIKTGMVLRVNGTSGYVEILSKDSEL